MYSEADRIEQAMPTDEELVAALEADDDAEVTETPAEEQPVPDGEHVTDEPASDINWDEVPVDEMRKAYADLEGMKKSVQADATRKWQEAAEMKKEAEALMQKAAFKEFYGVPDYEPDLSRFQKKEVPAEETEYLTDAERQLAEKVKEHDRMLAEFKRRESETMQREWSEHIDRTLNGFSAELVSGGMNKVEADNLTAEISREVSKRYSSYDIDSFRHAYKARLDPEVIAEAKAKKMLEEYKAQKKKDSEAGLVAGSRVESPTEEIDLAKLARENPDEYDRLMAEAFAESYED